jgi:hypothetical protein
LGKLFNSIKNAALFRKLRKIAKICEKFGKNRGFLGVKCEKEQGFWEICETICVFD